MQETQDDRGESESDPTNPLQKPNESRDASITSQSWMAYLAVVVLFT